MARIIRERYENGVLIERTTDGSTVKARKWLMLFADLVIAASLAVLAAVTLMDSLSARAMLGDDEVPSVFRLPKGGFHATSFS